MKAEYVLDPDHRKNIIVNAAVRVANETGLVSVTHKSVADKCSVETSWSTVRLYFPKKADLIKTVLESNGIDDHVVDQAREMGIK